MALPNLNGKPPLPEDGNPRSDRHGARRFATPPLDGVRAPREPRQGVFGRRLGLLAAHNWPADVVVECRRILRAMRPRYLLGLYVCDSDFAGSLIPSYEIAEGLRGAISRVTGGQTTYRHGVGDYCPPDAPWLREKTVVLETFLPPVFTDESRLQLIWLFVDFGRRARQDVVLVQVGARGFWIPTGQFRDSVSASFARPSGEEGLIAG